MTHSVTPAVIPAQAGNHRRSIIYRRKAGNHPRSTSNRRPQETIVEAYSHHRQAGNHPNIKPSFTGESR
jgi:hypothetical protein